MGITKIYPEKPDAKRVVMAPLQVTHQNAKIGLRALWEPTSSSMEIHPTTAHAAIVVQVRFPAHPIKVSVPYVKPIPFKMLWGKAIAKIVPTANIQKCFVCNYKASMMK